MKFKNTLQSLVLGGFLALSGASFAQNAQVNRDQEKKQKTDYFFNIKDTLTYDSTKVDLRDRNKDKIIDKINYIYYWGEYCFSISSIDTDFDGVFDSGVYRLSDKLGLINLGGNDHNNETSQLLKNEPEGRYKIK